MTGSSGPRSKRSPRAAASKAPSGVTPPKLPKGYDDRTIAWWDALTALPHAPEWLDGDWQVALRGAFVLELVWANPSGALLTELRRIEASLGMTRGDRERLGVSRAKPAPAMRTSRRVYRPDPRDSKDHGGPGIPSDFNTAEEYLAAMRAQGRDDLAEKYETAETIDPRFDVRQVSRRTDDPRHPRRLPAGKVDWKRV